MRPIKNASPEVIHLGTDDKSGRIVYPETKPLPQHLPYFMIFAKKGSTERVLTGGDALIVNYGAESFNNNLGYYNHATRFLNNIAAIGNTCLVKRLIPDDAGVRANVAIYIDVLDTKVPNYVRNSLGSYVIDPMTGEYQIDSSKPLVSGHQIKFIKTYNTVSDNKLGLLSSKIGTMTRAADGDIVKITFDGNIAGSFVVGATVAGADSGAVGVVKLVTVSAGKTNVNLNDVVGSFLATEEVSVAGVSLGELIESVDVITGTINSTMYPFMELKAKYHGAHYNNIGISINSLNNADTDTRIINSTKSLVYELALVERSNAKSSPQLVRSLFGEPGVNVSLKPRVINPENNSRMDIEHMFNSSWFNESDQLKPLKYNDYEGMHIYNNNMETVLGMVLAKEKKYISEEYQTWADNAEASSFSWFDFTTTNASDIMNEKYILNLFTCKSTKNIKYFTVAYNDTPAVVTGNEREINLSAGTPVFMDGGADGTMTNEEYEKLTLREMSKYLDPESEYMDLAKNLESMFYDSGFTLQTKKSLINFISLRKDTFIALSTHDASLGNVTLSLSESRGVALALNTRLKLSPESEYFGTSAVRGIVIPGAGRLRDSDSSDYIPLTYELAIKTAKMMGGSNGQWKINELFDKAPGNIITQLVSIQPSFIPAGIKATLWADGLTWAQPYDRTQYHFPALQTVYTNDTSVLNSYFPAMATCTLVKVAAEAWRNFTGSVNLSDEQFIEAVTDFVKERLKDRFAGMFTVIPEVVITEQDELRGYSWRLVTKIYANTQKSVMVHHTEAWRATDL